MPDTKLFPTITIPEPPAGTRNAAEIMTLCNQFVQTLITWYASIQRRIFNAADGATPDEINSAMGPAAGGVKLAGDVIVASISQLIAVANLGRETPLTLSDILPADVYPPRYDMTVNHNGTVNLAEHPI